MAHIILPLRVYRRSLVSTFSRSFATVFGDYGKQYKHNVMFLCNHNSCRSQMADGWLREIRALHPSASIGVASAGIEAGTGVKEGASIVMAEAGVPVSEFSSDSISDFDSIDFSHVISCCGCGTKLDGDKSEWKDQVFVFEDWNLDDPPATDPGDLSEYRRVRDEIKVKVEELVSSINEATPSRYV